MKRTFVSYSLFALLLAFSLNACKVTKHYAPPEPDMQGLYRDHSAGDTTSIASLAYNQLFTDAQLQQLISEGLSNNLNLKIAYSRVQAAEAYYSQGRAALQPSLAANLQASDNRLSVIQGNGVRRSATQYQAGLTAGWEADIWGRLSSAKRASLASLLQSQAYAQAVQTGIVANVAGYYYMLLALDQQLVITQQTVKNRIETVETIRALKDAAVLTGAAVVQSEASRYAAEVILPDLKQRIRETENALSILLGRVPGPIARGTLDGQRLPAAVSAGIPARLLANRPDVQQAEYNFRYYFEQTNVARASFYPSLTINASGGLSSLTLGNFFSSGSVFGSIGAGLMQPVFNRRINKTRLEVAKAQQQEALLGFQNSLLTAGQEVSNALSLYATAAEKQAVRTSQIANLTKSVAFTQELLKYGSANYTEVLTAQQSLLDAQLNSINDKLQQLQSVVTLYRALGGGRQ
jgi:NodT family efflux transporter outer membrane factor (OMF) lipoprotein